MLPARDQELVQIVHAALADATRRARTADNASWLACRPGCTPCCHGVFRISMLDAERLRAALQDLEQQDAARAAALRERARRFAEDVSAVFPGNRQTGVLHPEEELGWDAFADLPETDRACPVLDPATGRCELYTGRPLTCRIFGPPVQNDFGLGICELCYVGASKGQVLHGELHLQHHELEASLDQELPPGETIIAWALLQPLT